MFLADYTFFDAFWSMIVFFLWLMWFWLLFAIWTDIFRRHDISGARKALWLIFTIVLPFLGVLIYLIAENDGMTERNIERSRKVAEPIRRLRPSDGRKRRRRRQRSRRGRASSTAARSRKRSSTRSSRKPSPSDATRTARPWQPRQQW